MHGAADASHGRDGRGTSPVDIALRETLGDAAIGNQSLRRILTFVVAELVPNLGRTTDEITNLLAGLDGRYVPAGPSGAPTRGMAHVLPTGRNFYAVDPRALPSAAAWQVGQELAREVLERYRRDTGTLPETVGISMWGTAAMRTSGDDVAEVLALYGVRPVWQKENRRVLGVEAIPLAELGRPRIDVTVRISGFFRDAFPHLIRLLDDAASLVARLDEPPDRNFVRKHYLADLERFSCEPGERRGLSPPETRSDCTDSVGINPTARQEDAERRARYRVFGSKPGSYGTGLLPLIEERNWETVADLAETYVNWSGYAYSADGDAIAAPETFRHRLAGIEVALHNQDNREHDILDSDDYFQFHGGMIAAIRAVGGRPRHYFGDSADPAHPRVRDLKEEVLRVFRSRVVNPKWLESIQRHGYKGGLEMAATVDYLFGYDATADVVDDWMYEQVAQSYAVAAEEFLSRSNPWALSAIAERLLEAAGRGLWSAPSAQTLADLHELQGRAETALESRGETAEPAVAP